MEYVFKTMPKEGTWKINKRCYLQYTAQHLQVSNEITITFFK